MSERNGSHNELVGAILDRAAVDRTFRERLLNDPNGAIYDTFGIEVPEDYKIRFIERDPDLDALVVLPDNRNDEDEQLTDDDLDTVSGGLGTGFKWEMPLTPENRDHGE